MNANNIPGFTAEASIYKTSGLYWMAGAPNNLAGSPGVLAQLDNTVWTTDSICKACGCTVQGFTCNCGLRPRQAKLDCIKNGGPKRAVAFLGGALTLPIGSRSW
jgi:hypothetical protein